MRLIWLKCGALAVNTYIIGADDTTDVIVVDPGEASLVLERLAAENLNCTHILITHGHFDHTGGVAALQAATGAKTYIHEADAKALESARESLSYMVGRAQETAHADVLLHDGDTIDAAGLHIRVLHTPGHSKGGVCYVLDRERVLFCGDTLFFEGVGRTDFPGCSQRALYASIAEKLFPLAGDYTAYCGHDESTTLEHERAHNPFMKFGSGHEW